MILLLAALLAGPPVEVRVEAFLTEPRAPLRDEATGARIGTLGAIDSDAPAVRVVLSGEQPLSRVFTTRFELDTRADGIAGEPLPLPPASARLAGTGSAAIRELTVSAEGRAGRATLGRQRLTWGEGARGNLLLGGAVPLDAASAATPRWHGLSADAFLARLDDPWLTGQRLSWRPTRALTLSAQRTILCCEPGSGVRAADVLPILLATHENDDGHRLNFEQAASVSAALSTRHLRAWVEYGGTDLFGPRLDDWSGHPLPGFISPRTIAGARLAAGRASLLVEHANLDGNRSFLAHPRYPEGPTWLDRPIGHPAGGRAVSTLAVARWREWGAYLLEERLNLHTPARARRSRAGLLVVLPRLQLRAGLLEQGTRLYPELHATLELGEP